MPESIVDCARVDLIHRFNSFASQNMLDKSKYGQTTDVKTLTKLSKNNSGIWIFPSYFNHACVPNTYREYLGDFVLFYASRNIKQGEELTTQYTGLDSYEERARVCSVHFGFECDCALCRLELNDPNYSIRRQLLAKYDDIKAKISSTTSVDEKYLRNYYQKIRQTYKGQSEQFMNELAKPLQLLIMHFMLKLDFKKAADTLMETFEIVKDFDVPLALVVIYSAAKYYMLSNLMDKVKETLLIAKNYIVGDLDFYGSMVGVDFHQLKFISI